MPCEMQMALSKVWTQDHYVYFQWCYAMSTFQKNIIIVDISIEIQLVFKHYLKLDLKAFTGLKNGRKLNNIWPYFLQNDLSALKMVTCSLK